MKASPLFVCFSPFSCFISISDDDEDEEDAGLPDPRVVKTDILKHVQDGPAPFVAVLVEKLEDAVKIRSESDVEGMLHGLIDVAIVPYSAREWDALGSSSVEAIMKLVQFEPPSVKTHRLFWRVPRAYSLSQLETLLDLVKGRDVEDEVEEEPTPQDEPLDLPEQEQGQQDGQEEEEEEEASDKENTSNVNANTPDSAEKKRKRNVRDKVLGRRRLKKLRVSSDEDNDDEEELDFDNAEHSDSPSDDLSKDTSGEAVGGNLGGKKLPDPTGVKEVMDEMADSESEEEHAPVVSTKKKKRRVMVQDSDDELEDN